MWFVQERLKGEVAKRDKAKANLTEQMKTMSENLVPTLNNE